MSEAVEKTGVDPYRRWTQAIMPTPSPPRSAGRRSMYAQLCGSDVGRLCLILVLFNKQCMRWQKLLIGPTEHRPSSMRTYCLACQSCFNRQANRDADSGIIQRATYALASIAYWPDGAQAVVNANTLPHFLDLLESASEQPNRTHFGTSDKHEVMKEAIYALSRASQWLDGSDTNIKICAEAASALARISEHPDGVAVLEDTPVVQALDEISKLSDDKIHKRRHTILKNLSRDQQRKAAALQMTRYILPPIDSAGGVILF
ncbi:hypothetical protein B0H11DRAFT_2429822 [Mycena galericulata]|nr:hypothetical protein B0H11DRAFT_2429822 [Mycena galericulata]